MTDIINELSHASVEVQQLRRVRQEAQGQCAAEL